MDKLIERAWRLGEQFGCVLEWEQDQEIITLCPDYCRIYTAVIIYGREIDHSVYSLEMIEEAISGLEGQVAKFQV